MRVEDHQRLLRAEEEKAKAYESLTGELATLLGPQKPRPGVSLNDLFIAAVTQLLIAKEAAESQLEEVAQELEDRAGDQRFPTEGRMAFRDAAQLLRDKGTGVEDFFTCSEPEEKSPITAHKGTEQGGGDG